ncbi:hypothetical protein J6590_063449 [Homalodisca vitripennis]|nr:hypothetical protein J6590_063449 [Homalodisca vitripennis]
MVLTRTQIQNKIGSDLDKLELATVNNSVKPLLVDFVYAFKEIIGKYDHAVLFDLLPLTSECLGKLGEALDHITALELSLKESESEKEHLEIKISKEKRSYELMIESALKEEERNNALQEEIRIVKLRESSFQNLPKAQTVVIPNPNSGKNHMDWKEIGSRICSECCGETGAPLNYVVHDLPGMVKEFTTDDTVVIMGGANDIGKDSGLSLCDTVRRAVSSAVKTTVILCTIPYRYDKAKLNTQISDANQEFKNNLDIPNLVIHNINSGLVKKHYTRHGLHMNKTGKKVMSRILAKCIEQCYGSVANVTNPCSPVPDRLFAEPLLHQSLNDTQTSTLRQTIHAHVTSTPTPLSPTTTSINNETRHNATHYTDNTFLGQTRNNLSLMEEMKVCVALDGDDLGNISRN